MRNDIDLVEQQKEQLSKLLEDKESVIANLKISLGQYETENLQFKQAIEVNKLNIKSLEESMNMEIHSSEPTRQIDLLINEQVDILMIKLSVIDKLRIQLNKENSDIEFEFAAFKSFHESTVENLKNDIIQLELDKNSFHIKNMDMLNEIANLKIEIGQMKTNDSRFILFL